jgi:hypothetical protein
MTRKEKINYCVKNEIFILNTETGKPAVATAEEIEADISDEELDEAISKHSKAAALGAH